MVTTRWSLGAAGRERRGGSGCAAEGAAISRRATRSSEGVGKRERERERERLLGTAVEDLRSSECVMTLAARSGGTMYWTRGASHQPPPKGLAVGCRGNDGGGSVTV